MIDITSADLLPDTRARYNRNAKLGKWGIYWVPLTCASCSRDGGLVPEEKANFACYVCDDCYAKHGEAAGLMAEPDLVFWARVNAEMDEKYGRVLSPLELQSVIDAGSSPLASLFKDGATTKGRS